MIKHKAKPLKGYENYANISDGKIVGFLLRNDSSEEGKILIVGGMRFDDKNIGTYTAIPIDVSTIESYSGLEDNCENVDGLFTIIKEQEKKHNNTRIARSRIRCC